MNNVVLYTVMVGGYDKIISHSYVSKNWDYILFSDRIIEVPFPWRLVLIPSHKLDNTRKSRLPKILPHKFLKKYKYSVYVDANVDILNSRTEESINLHMQKKDKIALEKHEERDSYYDEGIACIRLNKDKEKIILNQINHYRKSGLGLNSNLYNCSMIYREHNDKDIIKCMEMWWDELMLHSCRDQISFPYVANFTGISVAKLFDENITASTRGIHFYRHKRPLHINLMYSFLKQMILLIPVQKLRKKARRKINKHFKR